MNYAINAEATFTFNGIKYLAKDFQNASIHKVEVYNLSIWASEGLEKFVGYASDIGLRGTLAKLALGQFEVDVTRRETDDGICALESANFIADFSHCQSEGSLRVFVIQKGSGRIHCEGELFPSIDSIRCYLGELEIEKINRSIEKLPAVA